MEVQVHEEESCCHCSHILIRSQNCIFDILEDSASTKSEGTVLLSFGNQGFLDLLFPVAQEVGPDMDSSSHARVEPIILDALHTTPISGVYRDGTKSNTIAYNNGSASII